MASSFWMSSAYKMLGLSCLGQLYLKVYKKKITFTSPNDTTEKTWMMFRSQMTTAAGQGVLLSWYSSDSRMA